MYWGTIAYHCLPLLCVRAKVDTEHYREQTSQKTQTQLFSKTKKEKYKERGGTEIWRVLFYFVPTRYLGTAVTSLERYYL